MRLRLGKFGRAACFLFLLSFGSLAQERKANEVRHPLTYSEVVSRAFQFSSGVPAEFKDVEYRIVVRFLPSSGSPESQVVFLRDRDGKIQTIQYRLKPGTRSLMDEYNEILQANPNATAEDVLSRVAVERLKQTDAESPGPLVGELFQMTIPTKLSSRLCTDGTTYEFWVQTPSNQIHASLSDCAFGENTDSTSIIRWIRTVEARFGSGNLR